MSSFPKNARRHINMKRDCETLLIWRYIPYKFVLSVLCVFLIHERIYGTNLKGFVQRRKIKKNRVPENVLCTIFQFN